MNSLLPSNRGIDVVILVNGKAIAGQKSAAIKQNVTTIDITNQITRQWKRILPDIKSWSIECTSLVIQDEYSFNLLENAYLNNNELEIEIINQDKNFHGKAYIVNFPINSSYDNTLLYNLTLQGTEDLVYVN